MPNYNKKKKCFMIKLKNWKKKTKISKVIFLLWKTKTRMKKQWSLLKMFKYLRTMPYIHTEMEKNERERRSFTFSSVQFVNLAHIFGDFSFTNVSDCGSYFWPSSVHFLVHFKFILCANICQK